MPICKYKWAGAFVLFISEADGGCKDKHLETRTRQNCRCSRGLARPARRAQGWWKLQCCALGSSQQGWRCESAHVHQGRCWKSRRPRSVVSEKASQVLSANAASNVLWVLTKSSGETPLSPRAGPTVPPWAGSCPSPNPAMPGWGAAGTGSRQSWAASFLPQL